MKRSLTLALLASVLTLPTCVFADSNATNSTDNTKPATTTASVTSSATATNDPASALVQKITQGQVKILQTFPAVGNLQGFVIQPNTPNDNRSMVVYADKTGDYMFIGTIIDNSGQNLTDQFTQKYVNASIAKTAFSQLPELNWFTQGDDKAPHKAYILIDPNCIYCHMLYQEVLPLIQKGQLAVRWIPVGFLHASSAGKAAKLLAASSAEDQLALLKQNETNFNTQQEEGGIEALSDDNDDPVVSAAFSKVEKNTNFFSQMGFNGTPTILYKDTSGSPNFYPGFAKGSQLQSIISSMGNSW